MHNRITLIKDKLGTFSHQSNLLNILITLLPRKERLNNGKFNLGIPNRFNNNNNNQTVPFLHIKIKKH